VTCDRMCEAEDERRRGWRATTKSGLKKKKPSLSVCFSYLVIIRLILLIVSFASFLPLPLI